MEKKNIKILVSESEAYYKEALQHIEKWLAIWSKANQGKRGYKAIRNKMMEMTTGKDYDFFVVFDMRGEYAGITSTARGAYDIALNCDMESFRVVRMTKQGEMLYFNYEPEGWLFTNDISHNEWYGEDCHLREEVKHSAVSRLERHLALPTLEDSGEITEAEALQPAQEIREKLTIKFHSDKYNLDFAGVVHIDDIEINEPHNWHAHDFKLNDLNYSASIWGDLDIFEKPTTANLSVQVEFGNGTFDIIRDVEIVECK